MSVYFSLLSSTKDFDAEVSEFIERLTRAGGLSKESDVCWEESREWDSWDNKIKCEQEPVTYHGAARLRRNKRAALCGAILDVFPQGNEGQVLLGDSLQDLRFLGLCRRAAGSFFGSGSVVLHGDGRSRDRRHAAGREEDVIIDVDVFIICKRYSMGCKSNHIVTARRNLWRSRGNLLTKIHDSITSHRGQMFEIQIWIGKIDQGN